jgi:hypothetical protein
MTSIITLPIRLSLDVAVRATKLGVGVVRAVAGVLDGDHDDARAPWPAEDAVVAEPAAPPAARPPEPEPEPPIIIDAPIDFDAPGEEDLAPRHVDSEPELAYESGPADDVGAAVHVEAPWEGYDQMRATDIVTRLRSANDATRAVVRLYEQQGKARSSVLAATG